MTTGPCPGISRDDLLTFALDRRPSTEAAAHCADCTPCRRTVARLRASRAALRTLGGRRRTGTPPDGRSGDAAALRASVARRLLRGRILGAARDRAWADLGRRLRALARAGRALTEAGGPPVGAEGALAAEATGTAADGVAEDGTPGRLDALRRWRAHRDALASLCRRLEGVGVLVDLDHLPTEPPAARTGPWADRHLGQLLDLVGRGGDRDGEPDEPYQPSAAPSFLDSLAPR